MRRRHAAFLLLSLAAIALCAGLGLWQLERLDWKRAILARMAERLANQPIPVEEVRRRKLAGEDIDFLRATAEGRFLGGREAYVFTSRDGLVGWQVIAPFETVDGTRLLVDRGSVPDQLKNPLTRPEARAQQPLALAGVARSHGERKGLFAPEDKPAEGIFYSWSPAEMARSLGLQASPDFILHADPQLGAPRWPEARSPNPKAIPNNHLQYAVTWFGLALVLSVMTLVLLLRRRLD